MTNEELVRQYYDGDETALDKLYRRNLGLIRSIAKEAAKEFSCLQKGRMTRWLEQNIRNLALSKDDMTAVRQAQKLYHSDWCSIDEISEKMDVDSVEVTRHIRYNTRFFGVYDLVPEDYDGDPFERLMPGKLSVPADRIVYRKVCIELLREMFDALPKKDRDILVKFYGIFGFKETPLKEIGMYHMMKESAVVKAKGRAIEKLKKAYPGSKFQLWKTVHRLMRRPILPPDDDTELRTQFPNIDLISALSGCVLNCVSRLPIMFSGACPAQRNSPL